jgi:hypothetical protein
VSEGSPPQRPPQVSPDGKWVWDGTEWQPVAGRDSGHTAVFPAFNPAALQASMVDPTPAATPFGAAPPVVNYAASYSAPQQTSAPLWQVKPGHWNKYLYVVAGVVVLVIAGIFLSSLGPISFPWFGASSQTVIPTPGPSLLAKRSDYARADRFVSGVFAPLMQDLSATISLQGLACNGVLTTGCQAALVTTEDKTKSLIATVNGTDVPVCIATSVSKISVDLQSMDTYLLIALKGYSDNRKSELAQGLAGFYYYEPPLQRDIAATAAARSTQCDTELTGP